MNKIEIISIIIKALKYIIYNYSMYNKVSFKGNHITFKIKEI